jgi:hypothetical protein
LSVQCGRTYYALNRNKRGKILEDNQTREH